VTVPTVPLVLVLVFAGLALAVSVGSFVFALSARRTAREALGGVRSLAAATAGRRRRSAAERDDPATGGEEQPERPRHRAPDTGARYSRLRASADARDAVAPPWAIADGALTTSAEAASDETTVIPAAPAEEDPLATREHPAPDQRFHRPPPPLPRPGAIGRPQ
jgi:hypothetical protein